MDFEPIGVNGTTGLLSAVAVILWELIKKHVIPRIPFLAPLLPTAPAPAPVPVTPAPNPTPVGPGPSPAPVTPAPSPGPAPTPDNPIWSFIIFEIKAIKDQLFNLINAKQTAAPAAPTTPPVAEKK